MASKKGLTIKIEADEIVYTNVSKSKDSYNSARMVAKVDDKVYMSISVEWEGTDSIPSFAMDLMGIITANKEEVKKSMEEKAEEYKDYEARR
jgi:hypothetical protein